MSQTPALFPADIRRPVDPEGFVQWLKALEIEHIQLQCIGSKLKMTGCKELLLCRVLLNEYHIAKILKIAMESNLAMDPGSPLRRKWRRRRNDLINTMATYTAAMTDIGDAWQARFSEMVETSTAGAEVRLDWEELKKIQESL